VTFVDGFGNRASGYPLINLDHVAVLHPVTKDGLVDSYRCLDAKGNDLGRIGTYHETKAPSAVVADTTGTILIGFWPDCHQRYPVLAWSVAAHEATPVICEELPDFYCLEQRDRTGLDGTSLIWVFPGDRAFDDYREVLKYAAERRQGPLASSEVPR